MNMIEIIDDFAFYMLPGANNGSFEFHEISKDEVQLLIANGYKAYIPDHSVAKALVKELNIKVNEQIHSREFYDNDEFILVKNKNNDLLGDIIPKYFHCIIHSDGVPYHSDPFDEI